MKILIIRFFLLMTFVSGFILNRNNTLAQQSIHQQQQEQFGKLNFSADRQWDSIWKFKPAPVTKHSGCELKKMVFGYHPYWMGSSYLNYQWNLISDLCYFSYEVDASSGNPTTTHDWLTATVIDSALANGVRIHLCVTLFSGHATFFSNALSKQTLISNIISLLQQRNATGVNMDVEALPSSQALAYNDFLVDLSNQIHQAIPGSIVSIAAPAVDWNGELDIPRLSQYIDYFMIMGYDYYWYGSTEAGPVGGLFPMTAGYNYAISRTVSWYQSQGAPSQKLLLGLPYYGRDWPTEGSLAPSTTISSGTAYTYRTIRNNSSGNYSPSNRHWESNSYTPYFAYNNGNWHQCFVDSPYSLGKRYDLANQRSLAGIGIWALGYDDGYTELWDLIHDRFTDCAQSICQDTIFDSGGPAFNYYNNESYTTTITNVNSDPIQIDFPLFNLESGYDSLWIYEGSDTLATFVGGYSGNNAPLPMNAQGGKFTLKFHSDGATTANGWMAIWACPWDGFNESFVSTGKYMSVFPNPCKSIINVHLAAIPPKKAHFEILDLTGRCVFYKAAPQLDNRLLLPALSKGIYLLNLQDDGLLYSCKFQIE